MVFESGGQSPYGSRSAATGYACSCEIWKAIAIVAITVLVAICLGYWLVKYFCSQAKKWTPRQQEAAVVAASTTPQLASDQSVLAHPGLALAGFAQPGFTQSGFTQSGFTQPGFTQPGFTQPGFTQPGFTQPGFTQQGFTQQGFTQPGFAQPAFAQSEFVQEAIPGVSG